MTHIFSSFFFLLLSNCTIEKTHSLNDLSTLLHIRKHTCILTKDCATVAIFKTKSGTRHSAHTNDRNFLEVSSLLKYSGDLSQKHNALVHANVASVICTCPLLVSRGGLPGASVLHVEAGSPTKRPPSTVRTGIGAQ